MAVKLLQVLLLGVIAAAADDDVPIRWVPSPRAALQCEIPNFERIPVRRPPPPLEGDVKPRPKPYIWKKGNEEVRRVNPNGTLEVARKRDADAAGVYQCQARYQSGYVLGYPFHLKFAYIDKQFSAHPSNASVWRGQPYVLSCSIASGPAAVITWLKDGEPVADDSRYYALNNQLLITAVSDEDAGLYKCRATNPVLNKVRTSHAGRLQVDDSPDFIERAFVPMHHEENIEVEKDSRIVLPCPMFGNPRPKLLWHFTPPGARRAEWDFVDEVLVLPRARPDHDGLYECRDDRNDQLLKTFNVTVTEAINITHAPESKQSVRASTVRFNCTATGKPTPKITWYKDGEEIKYAGRIDLVLSADDKRLRQLLIRSVTTEDAGVYQCVARSGARARSSWSWLEVVGAEAAAPRALACAPAARDRVRVAWTSVPANVVAYTVLTTSPDGNSLPDSPVEKTENTIKVKSPLTPYGFQVRAYIRSPSNKQNMANVVSDISEKVYCQGQGVPIKLAKEDDGSILVSWWQFYKETPGVVQWILQYKLNSNNNTKEHNITLDGNVYNYTLEVPSDDSIQVRVLGTRKLPWLQQDLSLVPWTASSTATNYAGPGEVQAIPEDVEITEVNARNFTVRWRCEQTMPGNYVYFVCVRSMGGNQECQESVVTTAIVRNLQPDTQYEVRVQARLPGKLAGDFSPPIQISTKPEGKGNVCALTYKYVNPSSIRVSWNSDPREYTVRYTDEFNLPQKQWNAVEVVGNTVLLTELDPTKTLYVFVEGHEPFGHSTRLDIPAQIPEAKDLQYNYTRSGIRVTWKGDGPREVKYSQNLTQTVDKWHSINVTDTSVQITGLDTSLPTFVMVKAPGPSQYNQVLNIAPRPADFYNLYLGIGIGCGLLLLCFLGIAAFCVWQKRKRSRPIRSRRRHSSPNEGTEEEGSEMKNVGGRLANGGGSKDAGEPLLNGHVHITENPSTKTPNGKLWKGRYEGAFDVTRYSEGDSTLETVIDDGPGYSLLDTSRRPEFDTSTNNSTFHFDGSANNSFHKLPDDNMNTAHWEPPAAAPTLQPNG